MISGYDIENYFSTIPTKTFAELSLGSNGSLIDSTKTAICYDDLVKSYCKIAPLKSVDSIMVKGKNVFFIEFKTGFKQKINKGNFDKNKWFCEHKEEICEENMKRFIDYQKLSYKEQKRSLNLKAVESICFFNGIILPQCTLCDKEYNLVLIVVVDVSSSPIDALQSMQNEMGGIETEDGNTYKDINSSFNKLRPSNFNGDPIFYDKIFVYSVEQFEELLLKH